ncbi:TetR/AcrR family transcriptional regulator [Pseudoxanthomonas composti]|uniref:TetR/AcrR family transcriptional regulator n=1 Tax=Pseudoxanthomonas composti TaxID=2137479 RepID=A0A4Q1JXP5_9GAMM|nr:TetR/AcrR family transcriptional regulator [Pseudoxanthomonas composti]RXR07278.1 TetR/AcrR family transcriptional regulator [Pseudoxanthomonas composti]
MDPSSATIGSGDVRRQRVYQAVRDLLAEQGLRISMDAVAQRAGCSKQTLYAHFGSKQELLKGVVHDNLAQASAELREADSLPQTLQRFAQHHLERLADPLIVASSQLVVAEARHFPDEARALFREGAESLLDQLAQRLGTAMERGELRHDDPHFAAELLLSMIAGLDFERQRFAVPARDADARRHWADRVVQAFLRMYTPS